MIEKTDITSAPRNFTREEPWRIFRIMAEFVDAFEILSEQHNLVAVFGSARIREDEKEYQDCVRLGKMLVENGYGVISGGGPGIMEAANKGAFENNGTSVGLNIRLPMEQHQNLFQNVSFDFRYFFIRKVCFIKYCTAVVVYPGGFGTLDEFAEVLTLIQTKKINPIPLVLIGKEFWTPLLSWFRNSLLDRHLISSEDMDLFCLAENADEALEAVLQYHKKNGVCLEKNNI